MLGLLITIAYVGFGFYLQYTPMDWVVAAVFWSVVYFSAVMSDISHKTKPIEKNLKKEKVVVKSNKTDKTTGKKKVVKKKKSSEEYLDREDACNKILDSKGYELWHSIPEIHVSEKESSRSIYDSLNINDVYDWAINAKDITDKLKIKYPLKYDSNKPITSDACKKILDSKGYVLDVIGSPQNKDTRYRVTTKSNIESEVWESCFNTQNIDNPLDELYIWSVQTNDLTK